MENERRGKMNRTIVAALILAALTVGSTKGKTWYVGTGGNDNSSNPHSVGSPYRTIQKAADMAEAGDEVVIKAGIYRESIHPANSGESSSRQIVYRPHGDGKVVVSGTNVVTGWEHHQGNIYVADVPDTYESKLHYTEQVFCDGEMMVLARHPNIPLEHGLYHYENYMTIDQVNNKASLGTGTSTPWGKVTSGGAMRLTFSSSELDQSGGFWDDAVVCVKNTEKNSARWGFFNVGPVLSHSSGKIECVIYKQPGGFSIDAGDPFCMMGVLGALDAPGEWYHDSKNGKLYAWIPSGDDPETHTMEVRRRDYAFDLSDRSFTTVKDITIFAATITTDSLYGDGIGFGAWLTHNRGTVDAPQVQGNAPAHNITIDGIRAFYISHFLGHKGNQNGEWVQSSGIMLVGSNHVLRNSLIAYSAGNGVSLFGENHVVENNIIHDVNYTGTLTSGIYVSETPGNSHETVKPMDMQIRHNTFVAAGWGMIDASNIFSSGPGKHSRVHNNFFDAPGLLTHDVGAFRVVGHRLYKNNPTPPYVNGTRIDHNIVRGCATQHCNSIYFDYSDGYVADHNIVYDSYNFFNINDGASLVLVNNTGLVEVGGIGGINRQLQLKEVTIRNNLTNKDVKEENGSRDPSFESDHNITKTDIAGYFVDSESGDFRLVEGAAPIDAGKVIAPYTDNAADGNGDGIAQPDIGAFEYGAENWALQVGANWEYEKHPTNLDGGATENGDVVLWWDDNATNENRYYVERGYKETQYGGWIFKVVGVVDANVGNFTDVVADTMHSKVLRYRVRSPHSRYSNTLYVDVTDHIDPTAQLQAADPGASGLRFSALVSNNPAGTVICYTLPRRAAVEITVHDLKGRFISALMSGEMAERGSHRLLWDGRNGSGASVSAGLYVLRISAGDQVLDRTVQRTR